jgi:pyrroline-5-carboxylate reductase
MSSRKISIIGCGNIGISILQGMLKSSNILGTDIIATRRNINELACLNDSGVKLTSDNATAVRESDLIIIAVKPYDFINVLEEIKEHLDPGKHILISITAGVKIIKIQSLIPVSVPVFRVMPNISACVNSSVSCISYDRASGEDIEKVKSLFEILGTTMTIDEELMESATILGACGIAYTLRYIRAMIQAGIQIGFDAKTASAIVNQTVKGAAQLLMEKKQHPEFEIDKVTTPKGCTIVGLNEMEHNGFSSSLIKGIVASFDRIQRSDFIDQ